MLSWLGERPVVMPDTHGRGDGEVYVLWPAVAYAALAPRVRLDADENLDVFEEALLGLVTVGVIDPAALAHLICIDHRLVRYILQGMEDRQLIRDGRVTERGKRATRLDGSPLGEASLGHVFRDGTTGEVWPRFLEGALPFVECDWSGPVPRVELGSVGRPRPARAVFVPPDAGVPQGPPSAAEVRHAVRDHRRALGSIPIDEDWSREVRPVDTDGQAVFLLLVLNSADALETGQSWSVSDPFGAPSPLLNQWVHSASEKSRTLARAIARVSERGTDRLELLDADPLAPALEALPAARSVVLDMREALNDVGRSGGATTRRRQDAALAIGRAFERLLRLLLAAHPAAVDRSFAVVGEPEHLKILLRQVFSMVGFEPVPASLVAVRASRVRTAIERSEGTARPLLLACAVAALDRPEHPLRRLAERRPDLLVDVAQLIDSRDASAHDWSGVPTPRAAIPDVDRLRHLATVIDEIVSEAAAAATPSLTTR